MNSSQDLGEPYRGTKPWPKSETARASLQAGIGHVVSTLVIALVVWVAGVAAAKSFGHLVDTASGVALIAFGGWIGISSWRELRSHGGDERSHRHDFPHLHGQGDEASQSSVHGPELQRIPTHDGDLELSIFEAGVPPVPPLRRKGRGSDASDLRSGDKRQDFHFASRGTYWESVEEIPEPHEFAVSLIFDHDGHAHATKREHAHGEHGRDHGHGYDHEVEANDDPLYAPLRGETAVLTRHVHAHRHGRGSAHAHWHDHTPASLHPISAETETAPPLCVYSTAGLQRVRLGAIERYGEVLSGAWGPPRTWETIPASVCLHRPSPDFPNSI